MNKYKNIDDQLYNHIYNKLNLQLWDSVWYKLDEESWYKLYDKVWKRFWHGGDTTRNWGRLKRQFINHNRNVNE